MTPPARIRDAAPGSPAVPRLRARLARLLGLRVLLALWAALALAILVAVLADALLALPEALRLQTPWFLALVGVTVLLSGAIALRRLTDVRVARACEIRHPSLGTVLTNAVQLARQPGATPVEEHLRRVAVAYGNLVGAGLSVWPVARRAVLRLASAAGAVAIIWIAAPLLFPDLLGTVLPRLFDPRGDHPPFSRVRIRVAPEGTEVLYGGHCEIIATCRGAPVEKLFLVAESGGDVARTLMFRRSDGTYAQVLANLREETRYFATDGQARSRKHTISIRYTPQITHVAIDLTFPEYTGLPPRSFELRDAPIQVPRRTRVAFRASSNRPLSGGSIALTPLLGGDLSEIPMAPAGEGEISAAGAFSAAESVAFTLNVIDVDGLVSAEPRKGRIEIVPDRRPQLAVLEPRQTAVATPNVAIPLHVRAEDDYGIQEILWFRGLNQSVERAAPLALGRGADPNEKKVSKTAEVRGRLDLAELGVRPGDKIEYFFEAVDNDPDGPNVTTSSIHTLEIISEEEYAALLRNRAAREDLLERYAALANHLRRLLEKTETLRDRAREMEAKGAPSDAEREALGRESGDLRRALDQYAGALARALAAREHLPIESAFRKNLREQEEQLERLERLIEPEDPSKGEESPLSAEKLEALAEALAGMQGGMEEEVARPARHLASVARLLARADEFVRLTLRQKEIVQLLRRFRDQEEPLSRVQEMEVRDLADAERRVREGLQRFMEEVPALAKAIPEEKEYDKLRATIDRFIEAVREAKIDEDLAGSADKLAALDGRGGFPPAESAYKKMDALVAKCEGMPKEGGDSMCLCFQPSLSSMLSESLAQLLAAMQSMGSSGSGGEGVGLLGQDVGIYGPDVQLAGAGRGGPEGPSASLRSPEREGLLTGTPESEEPADTGPGRVKLQRDVRFPLRYRKLIGEYFRVIAESQP